MNSDTVLLKREESMDQVHKRFTAEQVRVLLKGYCQGTLDRLAIDVPPKKESSYNVRLESRKGE